MSYFYLLLISVVAVGLGSALLWLIGSIVRGKLLRWTIAIWIDLLRVQFFVVVVLFTHPLQNRFIVFLMTLLVYGTINIAFGNGTIGTHLMGLKRNRPQSINPRRRVLLMVLFLTVATTITAGKSMLNGFDHIKSSTTILLSNQGSLAVDMHNVGTYDLVLHDPDNDKQVDELWYDINKDGKVDLIAYQPVAGSLDREVVSYTRQAWLLFYIGLIVILIAGLWYTKYKHKKEHSSTEESSGGVSPAQLAVRVSIVLLGSTQTVSALTIQEAHNALLHNQTCVQNLNNSQACAGIDEEVLIFFSHLKDEIFLADFRNYLRKYTTCVKSECDSEEIAELNSEFEERRETRFIPKRTYTTQSVRSFEHVTFKHTHFETMMLDIIKQVEEHKRWGNFQTELGATNYISEPTMLQLQVEFDKWRSLEADTIDRITFSLIGELELANRSHPEGFSVRIHQQTDSPKLQRQLTRLHRLAYSLHYVENYNAVRKQQVTQDIKPYILYAAIGVGEQMVQANPWDTLLTLIDASTRTLGSKHIAETLASISLKQFVEPKLYRIAEAEFTQLDSAFQQERIRLVKARDDPSRTVVQKGQAFFGSLGRSALLGVDMVIHETLFMSEDYLLILRQRIDQMNKLFTLW